MKIKSLSVEEIELEIQKRELESNTLEFTKWNFEKSTKQEFIVNDHHTTLAEGFQKVLDGKVKLLLVTIPPRYTKTEFVKQFCAQGFARNPASQFIYTSYSDQLAMKCSNEIKEAISHEEYKTRWPIELKKDTNAKKLWETTDGGGMYATSFGGPITGFGAGKLAGYKSPTRWEFNGAIIVDDPLKAQDRHRKLARQSVVDYYTGTLPSRFNDTTVPLIVIMQRLHKEDLAGHIIENDSDQEGFLHINMPAIKEDGTALWPAKHTLEDLERLSRNNEMFQSQYLQRPILLGGNLIKPEEFKRYEILPFLKKRYITVDTALKDKEHNDWTVFQCWGTGVEGGVYLIDNLRIKINSNLLKSRFIDFWNKHHGSMEVRQYGHLTAAYVEDKSSGTQLIQEIQSEGKIPIIAVQRSRSKLERVVDILLPRMAAGYVYIPTEAPWMSDYIMEHEEFDAEGAHAYDDQVDCTVDGVEIGIEYSSGVDDKKIIGNNINRNTTKPRRRGRR